MTEPDINGVWNFSTFEKYINQRFTDLSLQLSERYAAQQIGVTAALSAAEKAVNAALIAAEKAVDKAEHAQSLRNEAQNEFRKSLSDLSTLMWTAKEGQATVDALRREYMTGHATLTDRIATLEFRFTASENRISGRASGFGLVGQVLLGVVAFVSAVAVAIGLFLRH